MAVLIVIILFNSMFSMVVLPLGEAEAELFQEFGNSQLDEHVFRKWHSHSVKERSRLGMPHDQRPWTSHAALCGVPQLDRVRDLLDVGYYRVLREAQLAALRKNNVQRYDPEALKATLWTDCSQAVQRKPIGPLHALHCNSYVYSHAQDLVIPGVGHFHLHGYPRVDLSMFGDSDKDHAAAARQLMGESFSLPSGSQVLLAAILTARAPWWQQ